MKKLIVQYAAYNLWASQLLVARIKELPEDVIKAKVPGSFESLLATVLHLWDAENMWWQRMNLEEKVMRPSEGFTGTFTDLAANLLQQSKQWHHWVLKAQEHVLDHEFIYYNSKKEKYKQATYLVLMHVFNHSTYHRGQMVTILRQLGISNIPGTDFIVWSRKK